MATGLLGACNPQRRRLRRAFRLHPLQPRQTWPCRAGGGLAAFEFSSVRADWNISARLDVRWRRVPHRVTRPTVWRVGRVTTGNPPRPSDHLVAPGESVGHYDTGLTQGEP